MTEPVIEYAVDWPRVIDDLRRAGLSLQDIVDRANLPRSTVRDWRRKGSDATHRFGERLLDLWVEATGTSRDLRPRRAWSASAPVYLSGLDASRQLTIEEAIEAISTTSRQRVDAAHAAAEHGTAAGRRLIAAIAAGERGILVRVIDANRAQPAAWWAAFAQQIELALGAR